MNVILVQLDIAWEDKPANFSKVRQLLTDRRPEANSLVVLPEMFATGFSMNVETIAEPYRGPTEQFLSSTAREFGICLVAGAAMRAADGRVRNKALVFSPTGELVAFYAKMRLFTPGDEPKHFVSGEQPIAFQWQEWTISPFICYDLRFPELFREAAAGRQPELFAVIANFPAKRIKDWIRLLQARAIENQAFVLGVNRIGSDPYCAYNGHSLIIDPCGDILADAGESEGCTSAKLDLAGLHQYREKLPFLRDLTARTDRHSSCLNSPANAPTSLPMNPKRGIV